MAPTTKQIWTKVGTRAGRRRRDLRGATLLCRKPRSRGRQADGHGSGERGVGLHPSSGVKRGRVEFCMLSRPQRLEIGMCGASRRSSSSAAYSQTLSGPTEGLSTNNVTPLGDPQPVTVDGGSSERTVGFVTPSVTAGRELWGSQAQPLKLKLSSVAASVTPSCAGLKTIALLLRDQSPQW
jgi:hypothetical protein